MHATLAQPAAGADSLKDLRARRAQDHACLAVYILKVYILKMTLLVPVEPVVQLYRTAVGSMLVDTSTIHFSVSCTSTAVTGGSVLVLLIAAAAAGRYGARHMGG